MSDGRGLTEIERYKAALVLAMQFLDRCAGIELGFDAEEDLPETQAQDVSYAIADVLGLDVDSDSYRALVAYPAGRAALAERGGSEHE